MKISTHIRRAPRHLLAAAALLAGLATAPALTVPVAQDTYSLPTGKVAAGNGNGVNLPVNAKQTALLRFDLSDLAVVPNAIQPGNIKSATLRLYVTSAKPAGVVTVRGVTTTWKEHFTGVPVALPTIASPILATIPSGDILPKSFVTVDLTDAVVAALQAGNDFGFALQCSDPAARVLIASKEGAATGYAAELEIVANTATDGNGNLEAHDLEINNILANGGTFTSLGAVDTVLSGKLSVSNAFVVEPRPNNTTAGGTFIGKDAGKNNTTGDLNIFVGGSAGAANTGGYTNTFVGYASGFNNTTGNGNCALGYYSGFGITTGLANVCVGISSGRSLGTGSYNTFLGVNAGFGMFGDNNIAIGNNTGYSANTGARNIFIGSLAGSSSTSGDSNVFLGYQAGALNTADQNVYIGEAAGKVSTGASQNVYVGFHAGTACVAADNTFVGWNAGKTDFLGGQNSFLGANAGANTTESFDTFFGAGAGEFNTTGTRVTSIGNVAGRSNTTGSNNTYVGDASGLSNTVEDNNTFVGQGTNGAAGITNSTAVGQGATVTVSNAVVLGNNCSVGIRTSAPNSVLQVNGSISLPIRTNSVVLAGLDQNDCVLINTANSAGIQLPSAVGISGRVYYIKNRAGTAATLGTSPVTQTIDGATTLSIPANTCVQIISNGANWFRIDQ